MKQNKDHTRNTNNTFAGRAIPPQPVHQYTGIPNNHQTTNDHCTPAADDEEDSRETSKPNSENEGHEADMVNLVEEVSKTDTSSHNSSSPDATTGETLGPKTVNTSKKDKKIVYAFTTPTIVKDIENDMAIGPNSGVDDHTLKFPLPCEATVCAKVAPCCIVIAEIEKVLE